MIALTSIIAIFLTQSEDIKKQKFASIFGLIGQPFWFISSYESQQWGIFILCFLYTFAWLKGFYRFWVKKL